MKKINNFMLSKRGVMFSLSIVFVLILCLNCLTIWAADDYAFYNNVWLNQEKFSILRVFERSKEFYFAWTGRFLSTFINYIFLYLPKIIFNIANSAVYTGLVYIIYKIVKNKSKYNGYLLLGVFLMTWLLVPSVGQVMFWQIGSVIYLWMYFLVALLIYFYTELLKKNSKLKDNLITILLLFLLGLAAGNGFETNSIVLLAFLFLVLIYIKFIQKNKLPKWAIFTFVATIIGSCFNFFSPGNAVRMTQMGSNSSFIDKIINNIGPWFYNGILRSKLFIVIILLILAYTIYIISKKKTFDKKILFTMMTITLFVGSFIFFISIFLPPDLGLFLEWFYPNYIKFWFLVIILMCFLALMIITFIVNHKTLLKGTDKTTNSLILFYTFSALLGVAAYIMTPTAWPRSYMGMSLTLIIAIIYIVERTEFKFDKIIPIAFIFMIILSASIYCYTIIDAYKATKWFEDTDNVIKNSINEHKSIIYVDTFTSKSNYNGASVEKWVIPIEIDGKIPSDYEWINIAITNYYFNDSSAWQNGNRIIGR